MTALGIHSAEGHTLRKRIGAQFVFVHISSSTQYATVYRGDVADMLDASTKPVATLTRKRVMDRSDAKRWSIATTDGNVIAAHDSPAHLLAVLCKHLERVEVEASDDFDAFNTHMLATALWSSTDDEGEPLDAQYDIHDIDDDSADKLRADALAFYIKARAMIQHDDAPLANDFEGSVSARKAAMAGHDFWLTRCGHGAGFWDGDWPEAVGDALSEMAREAGNVDLYVGDDNKIHA